MLRLALAAAVSALCAAALDFHVDPTTVNECGQTRIEFTPGTPPYQVTAMAAFSTIVNFTIPDSAVSADGGTYSMQLPFAANKDILFIMSDATGFGSGGVSQLYKVGGRPNAATCQLASENPPYTFAVYPEGDQLAQCTDVHFTWEGAPNGPVFIFGVVPGGMMQVAAPATGGQMSFGPAKFPVNTTVLYGSWDASGQSGGTSRLQNIVASSSTSCMQGDNVLSTTPVNWNPTSTASGEPTHASTTRAGVITVTSTALPKGATGLTPGAIAGLVVGVIVGVLILQALILWFCCRRQVNNYLSNRRARQERKAGGVGTVDLYEHRPGDIDGNFMALPRRDEDATISPFLGGTSGDRSSGWGSQHSLHSPSTLPLDPRTSYASNSTNSTHLPPGAFQSQAYPSRTSGYPPPAGSAGHGVGPGVGIGNSSRLPTKLQLAMANPDNETLASDGPPSAAPSGGFRRHEDAGRVNSTTTTHVEDLPPTYNPQWDRE